MDKISKSLIWGYDLWATAGLTSGIAASGALGNTSAIIFGSMVGLFNTKTKL